MLADLVQLLIYILGCFTLSVIVVAAASGGIKKLYKKLRNNGTRNKPD